MPLPKNLQKILKKLVTALDKLKRICYTIDEIRVMTSIRKEINMGLSTLSANSISLGELKYQAIMKTVEGLKEMKKYGIYGTKHGSVNSLIADLSEQADELYKKFS